MKINEIELKDYLFNIEPKKLNLNEIKYINDKISTEMEEIYYGRTDDD